MPWHALAQLLLLRAGLALRGFEFRERPETAIPVDQRERIDACWTGIIALNSFDAIRSGAIQARHTFRALAAGEPKRVARALTLAAAYRAFEAIGRFPEIGFQSPHYAALIAQTRIDLYERLGWQA
jgi:hypothetical protein